jgi:hypothetical protein
MTLRPVVARPRQHLTTFGNRDLGGIGIRLRRNRQFIVETKDLNAPRWGDDRLDPVTNDTNKMVRSERFGLQRGKAY